MPFDFVLPPIDIPLVGFQPKPYSFWADHAPVAASTDPVIDQSDHDDFHNDTRPPTTRNCACECAAKLEELTPPYIGDEPWLSLVAPEKPVDGWHASLVGLMKQTSNAPVRHTKEHKQKCECCLEGLVHCADAHQATQLQKTQAFTIAVELQQSRLQVLDMCKGLRSSAALILQQAEHYKEAITKIMQGRLEAVARAANVDVVELTNVAAKYELFNPFPLTLS